MPGEEKEPTFEERLQATQAELEQLGQERAYEPDRLLSSHVGALALVDEGVKSGELDQKESIALKLSFTGAAKAVAKKKGDSVAESTFKTFEDTFKVMRDLAKKQGTKATPRKQRPAKTSAAKSGKPKSKQDT